MKRLFIGHPCHCGSRQWHLFDMFRNKHLALCAKRHHESYVDVPWAPTQQDFFCACGGAFLPTTNRIVLASGIEVMRDFVCPACATRWRITAPPEDVGGETTQHAAITLALLHGSSVSQALLATPLALANAQVLRNYTLPAAPASGLVNFFRNLFHCHPEPRVPPDSMPEKAAFLRQVAELIPAFEHQFEKERAAGLLCWCKSEKQR